MKKTLFKNGMIDLAQSRLGTKVVYKTDEFFAQLLYLILIEQDQSFHF